MILGGCMEKALSKKYPHYVDYIKKFYTAEEQKVFLRELALFELEASRYVGGRA